MRSPRASAFCVAVSSSDPNCANASSSRYCARSRRRRPATLRIARCWAFPPTRETDVPDVDRRAHAREEEVRLEEDLPVGDGDDVGGDVGGEVAGLRLDDGERGQRASAEVVGELAGTFEQPRVQVEDVAGKRLATRRAAEQQAQLAIAVGVLGEVVVDRPARACRCRGSTRPSRSPRTGPST